jgi:hypothetical protein
MEKNALVINGRTAVSIGLVITLLGSLIAAAVSWGKMQAQLAAKLDCAVAEREFVRQAELSRQLDSMDRRLARIEDKLDKLLAERG